MNKGKSTFWTRANQLCQITQGILPTLSTANKYTCQNLLSASTGLRTIAAKYLTVCHCWTNCLFGRPIGGLNVRLVKKCKNLVAMTQKMISKSTVLPMRQLTIKQSVQPFLQPTAGNGQTPFTNTLLIPTVAQIQGPVQEISDSFWKLPKRPMALCTSS